MKTDTNTSAGRPKSVEYERFTNLVERVLSVPHSLIKRRIEEHREAVAKNPHRRGPKSKKS